MHGHEHNGPSPSSRSYYNNRVRGPCLILSLVQSMQRYKKFRRALHYAMQKGRTSCSRLTRRLILSSWILQCRRPKTGEEPRPHLAHAQSITILRPASRRKHNTKTNSGVLRADSILANARCPPQIVLYTVVRARQHHEAETKVSSTCSWNRSLRRTVKERLAKKKKKSHRTGFPSLTHNCNHELEVLRVKKKKKKRKKQVIFSEPTEMETEQR